MTATTPTTTAELRTALAAAEAEERAEQARQAAQIREARAARAQKIFDAARGLEDELSEIGDAHYKEAVAAATVGDLNGAYAGFVGYLGARSARGQARNEAQTAANILGRDPHTAADVTYRQMPFSDFIDSNLHNAVQANAGTIIAPYLTPEIDDIATATAYLHQGK